MQNSGAGKTIIKYFFSLSSERDVTKVAAIKIKDGIYSVGVLNPNLRIFDVIMKTDYGTSYNAYLIKSEKNVLIVLFILIRIKNFLLV
jgi:hypothetical protein